MSRSTHFAFIEIPAKAGIYPICRIKIPAFAGISGARALSATERLR